MDLTRRFTEQQYAAALESWQWLGLDGKSPMFTSAFGDVFFRAADGIWWLDTFEGTLTRRWQTLGDLQSDLNTAEGQDQCLPTGLALAAGQAGLVPGMGQILSFRHPPSLGGYLDIGNVQVSGFVVAVNIAGQIRDQNRSRGAVALGLVSPEEQELGPLTGCLGGDGGGKVLFRSHLLSLGSSHRRG